MKLSRLVSGYLNNSSKLIPIELTYIEGFICDDCYKIQAKTDLPIPSKCLLLIEDFDLNPNLENLSLTVLKATVRSTNVKDYCNYLCLVDHSPEVVQSLQKYKYSQVIKRVEDSDITQRSDPLLIGFGLKSANKSSEFARRRKFKKILESQDDMLTALIPEEARQTFAQPIPIKHTAKEEKPPAEDEEFPDFPEWALIYLSSYLKINNG